MISIRNDDEARRAARDALTEAEKEAFDTALSDAHRS
jgi:hypothetical protein